MADSFSNYSQGLASPGYNAAAVTPDDATDLTNDARFLYVGVTGDVVVITSGGDTVTFKAAPVGLIWARVRRVKNTGTTATNILALR